MWLWRDRHILVGGVSFAPIQTAQRYCARNIKMNCINHNTFQSLHSHIHCFIPLAMISARVIPCKRLLYPDVLLIDCHSVELRGRHNFSSRECRPLARIKMVGQMRYDICETRFAPRPLRDLIWFQYLDVETRSSKKRKTRPGSRMGRTRNYADPVFFFLYWAQQFLGC